MRTILFVFFTGCSIADLNQQDTGFIEDVSCSHPSSQFEAQIDILFETENSVASVEFALEQYGEWWFINLNPPNEDEFGWSHRMQIYEFMCSEPFYYDFIEESKE
jgi:hypothetical protein